MFIALVMFSYGQAKFEIGLKGGANFAKSDLEQAGVSADAITSWHGGAYALIKITKIGIQPEILYSSKGSELRFGSLSEDLELTYVDIPVMLKLYLWVVLTFKLGHSLVF